MAHKVVNLDDRLYHYLQAASPEEPDVLKQLREATARLPEAGMQITPEQGQFMALLVRLTGARNVLEIGVFTGYSALAVLLALPGTGRLVACDVSETWTAIARRYWELASVSDRVDLRIGPALTTLDQLLAEGRAGQFDLAFIDADKTGYDAYYERCLSLLRPGGLIILDNLLWGGKVADPGCADADTVALRAMNAKLRDDSRVAYSLLPLADGLGLAMKL
jgi:predicted O-methyltransferase YrrM